MINIFCQLYDDSIGDYVDTLIARLPEGSNTQQILRECRIHALSIEGPWGYTVKSAYVLDNDSTQICVELVNGNVGTDMMYFCRS